MHTIFSDGTWEPAELVGAAQRAGLAAIAVTDHDSTAGVEPTQAAAKGTGLCIVPGVELSLRAGEQAVDTLGYFVNPRDAQLSEHMAELRAEREARAAKMVMLLQESGAPIAFERVQAIAGRGAIGRPHVAAALVEAGYANDVKDAFARWIGRGRPGFVARDRVAPKTGMEWIRAAGGVPVLAHPGLLKDDSIIPGLIDAGLAGIEVYHSAHDNSDVIEYLRLAERYGLVVTGGSDCHGPGGPKGDPLLGSVRVPLETVDRLRAAVCGGLT